MSDPLCAVIAYGPNVSKMGRVLGRTDPDETRTPATAGIVMASSGGERFIESIDVSALLPRRRRTAIDRRTAYA